MIRIVLAQIDPTVGALKENVAKMENCVQKAIAQQADLIVFPELCLCGYPPEDLLLKDHFVKDNIKALEVFAKKVKGITVVTGFVDQDKKRDQYNAAAVIQSGKIRGIYHKQCLPNYGVFDEKRYFKSGKSNKQFKLKGVPYAISICEDIWEDVCAKQAKSGAKLLINISSSPYDVGKLKERERLVRSLAKGAKAYVCYCNLVGGQDELVFDGSSMVVDPKGNIVGMAKEFEEDLLVVDLDLGKQKKGGDNLRNHIHKPSKKIARIYKALVMGTRDYTKKNGFEKVLIGLSGGIDSSLVAALAVEALGKDNVIGLTMPSQYSSEGTRSDARQLAQNLGIELKEVAIEGIFNAFLEALEKEFKGTEPNIAEENIQARIRGNLLMGLSNKFGWLVLTTGNKSEVAVGYCTLYGDMSGGFAVIKDVPKTLVYELCHYINKGKGEVIPPSILERPPTAELRVDQKDQDILPPYDKLDVMLKDYVEEHKSLAKMAKGKDMQMVKEIIAMVDRNEYKRRQSPPGIKITPRAFGKDWRLPITNKYKEF